MIHEKPIWEYETNCVIEEGIKTVAVKLSFNVFDHLDQQVIAQLRDEIENTKRKSSALDLSFSPILRRLLAPFAYNFGIKHFSISPDFLVMSNHSDQKYFIFTIRERKVSYLRGIALSIDMIQNPTK